MSTCFSESILRTVWCRKYWKKYRKIRMILETQFNKLSYISIYTQGFKFFVYKFIYNIFFHYIQMHYILKQMKKSVTLGFPLFYCGTFTVNKWKIVLLEYSQWYAIELL